VSGGYVYWSDDGANQVGRAKRNGSGKVALITGAATPTWIAVGGGHIYWGNSDTNTIGRANLDGSGASQAFISHLRR
jgi:hypothetical protein